MKTTETPIIHNQYTTNNKHIYNYNTYPKINKGIYLNT